jgi:hypothetical protein
MNSKERFIAALNHKAPDRVPLDLGGWVTTINIKTYNRLVKKCHSSKLQNMEPLIFLFSLVCIQNFTDLFGKILHHNRLQ